MQQYTMKKKQSPAPCEPTVTIPPPDRWRALQDYSERFFHLTDMAESAFISMDLMRLILGDKIGSGAYRTVFDCPGMPGTVIKCAPIDTCESNMLEWNYWKAAKGQPLEKWLAPCIEISPGGHFLLQKKCRPISDSDKLTKKIPNVFEDLKRENWGFFEDRLVCHDYQFIGRALDIAFNSAMRPFKIK